MKPARFVSLVASLPWCGLLAWGCGGDDSPTNGGASGSTQVNEGAFVSSFRIDLRVFYDLGLEIPGVSNFALALGSKTTATGNELPDGCTRESFDGCTATFCAGSMVPDVTSESLTAGELSVTGGSISYLPFMYLDGAYTADAIVTKKPLYGGGELLEARATGGDIGPFSVQVTAPAHGKLSGLPAPMNLKFELDTSQDLTLTPEATGATLYLNVSFLPENTLSPRASLICSHPANGSPLVIPSAILQKSREANTNGIFRASFYNETTQKVGEADVRFRASNYPLDDSGKPLSSALRFTLK